MYRRTSMFLLFRCRFHRVTSMLPSSFHLPRQNTASWSALKGLNSQIDRSSAHSSTSYSILYLCFFYFRGNLKKVVIYAKGFSLASRRTSDADMILKPSYGSCLITLTGPRRHLLIFAWILTCSKCDIGCIWIEQSDLGRMLAWDIGRGFTILTLNWQDWERACNQKSADG